MAPCTTSLEILSASLRVLSKSAFHGEVWRSTVLLPSTTYPAMRSLRPSANINSVMPVSLVTTLDGTLSKVTCWPQFVMVTGSEFEVSCATVAPQPETRSAAAAHRAAVLKG